MRLSNATVDALAPSVARPGYDRTAQAPGIVHLGIGAFHRAHQAVYTDDAMVAGDRDWRITGVSLRSPGVRDALVPQDGLYTVIERADGGERIRLIGALDRVLAAPEDPDAVVAALAAPATHVVTLTVTEKGYHRHPATGRLLRDDPAIAAELAGGAPTTIYGFLAAAFARRRADGAGPLTLVSCDNLPGNGRLLAALLGEFLDARDPGLRGWADANVASVDTMVDRIVPAVTGPEIARASAMLGVADEGVVVTEPFRQWVVEDRFAGPRPRWEAGGAQLVADVAPFELAKLRLLNGSHSSLAYIGLQLGHAHVHEAIADPDLGAFVAAQMKREAAPSLTPADGLDTGAYVATILDRFGNADLPHRLAQIATDGSQKLPQRWIATILDRHRLGQASPHHVASLAAWLAYTRRLDGTEREGSDPLAGRYAAIWGEAGREGKGIVDRFAGELGIFPDAFATSASLMSDLRTAFTAWIGDGPRGCLRALAVHRGGPA